VPLAVLIGFAQLYRLTLAPTLAGGDSAELAGAAACFGVPHPPGYPLYTLVTGLVLRAAPMAPDVTANAASAGYALVALALAAVFVRRLGASSIGVVATLLALGGGATFWSQATVAEVYTFDVALALAVFHATLTLARRAGASTALGLGLAVGAWLGHRPVNLLFLPALALCARGGWSGPRLGGRALAWLAGGVVLTGSVFVYLPLASARDPAFDVGDPETWDRFLVVVRATPYLRHLEGGTAALAWARFGRAVLALPSEVGLAVVLAPLALASGLRDRSRERWVSCGWLLFVATNLAFASRYHVLDVDVFFLPTALVLAVLASHGADALARGARWRSAVAWLLVLAAGIAPLPARFTAQDRSAHDLPRRFAEDLLASVPEDGVLFVQGDTSIHTLAYLQGIEQRRTDVAVVSLGHVRPWYLAELRRRHPDVPWPPLEPEEPPSHWARRLVDVLPPFRPVFLSGSVDPTPFTAPPEKVNGRAYGTVPRALVSWLLPHGTEVDARALSDASAAFFDARREKLADLPRALDMDSKSIVAQYALALDRACELWSARGEDERVAWGSELILALEADRHERDVRADVRRGFGQELPRLGLERKARARLDELAGR